MTLGEAVRWTSALLTLAFERLAPAVKHAGLAAELVDLPLHRLAQRWWGLYASRWSEGYIEAAEAVVEQLHRDLPADANELLAWCNRHFVFHEQFVSLETWSALFGWQIGRTRPDISAQCDAFSIDVGKLAGAEWTNESADATSLQATKVTISAFEKEIRERYEELTLPLEDLLAMLFDHERAHRILKRAIIELGPDARARLIAWGRSAAETLGMLPETLLDPRLHDLEF